MTALPLEALDTATPEAAALSSDDDPLQPETARVATTRCHSRRCALDLSRSRTHDAVLDILKAYKLSGNFHDNLGAVLRDMGVSGMVAYEVEPGAALAFPDCRHVVFTGAENVPGDRFDDVVATIRARIGFAPPWWARQWLRLYPGTAGADQMRRCH